jgi:hypothetical protein
MITSCNWNTSTRKCPLLLVFLGEWLNKTHTILLILSSFKYMKDITWKR